jgi:type VI protein secretion system component Hcp
MAAKKNEKNGKGLKRSKKLQGVKPLAVMAAASPLNLTQGATSSAGAVQHADFSVTKVVDNASPSLFQQATGTGSSGGMTTVTLPVVPE